MIGQPLHGGRGSPRTKVLAIVLGLAAVAIAYVVIAVVLPRRAPSETPLAVAILRKPSAAPTVESATPSATPPPSTATPTATPVPASATPSATPSPHTPRPSVISYTVKAGDILGAIARDHDVSAATIAAASGIEEESVLQIGQVLTIPLPTEEPSPTPAPEEEASGDTAEPAWRAPSAEPSKATASPTGEAEDVSEVETGEAAGEGEGGVAVYVVQNGDTLSGIAAEFGVPIRTIMEANRIEDAELVRVGEELRIPLGPPTPTPTPTHVPTPTPTSGPPYPAPQLMSPADGAALSQRDGDILLNWTAVDLLADDEWYLTRVWRETEGEVEFLLEGWTKETSWRHPADDVQLEASAAGLPIWWSVVVVRRLGEIESGPDTRPRWTWVGLSPESESRSFTWRP